MTRRPRSRRRKGRNCGNWLTSKFSCFDAELSGFTLRILSVLEITEAMLDGSVQETRANFSAVYQACTKIIPDLKAKLADAEAENTRLTKMVDWLANQLYCPSEFTNCAVDCAECRKEAARRAVAAGEE